MSSADSMLASQLDITWGCLFIGLSFLSALWGTGCPQLYLYCEKYWKTDQRWFKLYILLIWILDTVHQVFTTEFYYVYFVKGIIAPELRTSLQMTLVQVILLANIIDAMIQIVLVRRVWCLSDRNRILTTTLSIAVLAQFATTTAVYFKILKLTKLAQIFEDVDLQLAGNAVEVFTDTFLAASLVSLLWKARSGLHSSNSIVNRLMTYIVGSSLITILCMLVAVIADIVAPHSLIHETADLIISKHAFSVLQLLNARSSLRENLVVHAGEISFHLTVPFSGSEGQMNSAINVSSKTPVSTEYTANADIEAAQRE